ncbi:MULTISPECIES: VOC family protein [unclassified Shinella]|uniref:VOC family protein n=1 Tax=unclassified Shinella TaxID=2643062 RepID=UPI00225C9CBF|nr:MULTISPECIES: VOC family protein [unclassified Shinella]CAI0334145.1 Glyoxalase [Rhizobiaceae bacterium]CAK7261799.1 Glyoxalase [Shinella sp. WSC3-e]MDC7259708.1 VOC family protein [Shinella sp. YE25]MDC7266889.1 VOC family protein [Shinella sp. HY16]MDC7273786.1 VOC family protein [Shinella sp. YZ44]
MKFASLRLIARDINGLVAFYEMVTGLKADWLAPVFAEIVTPSATIAIGSAETVALFQEGTAEPGANRTAIIELQVANLDAEFERLKDLAEIVHLPKLLPWGNQTFQIRDPEGTLVSLYMPVTEAAKARFGNR